MKKFYHSTNSTGSTCHKKKSELLQKNFFFPIPAAAGVSTSYLHAIQSEIDKTYGSSRITLPFMVQYTNYIILHINLF